MPPAVAEQSKRFLLDSIGTALAAVDSPKGRIGIDYGRMTGASGKASVIGTGDKLIICGRLRLRTSRTRIAASCMHWLTC